MVLDRVVTGVRPDYEVFGTTVCGKCDEMVWVAHDDAHKLTSSDNIWPLCLVCAEAWEAQNPGAFIKTEGGQGTS